MKYYHLSDNVKGAENYSVTISSKGGDGLESFVGYISDSSLDLPFGISLTNRGALKSGRNDFGKSALNVASKLPKVGALARGIQQGLSVAGDIMDATLGAFGEDSDSISEMYSVVKPSSWNNLDFSVTCRYYKGLHSGSCNDYKSHALALAKWLLPNTISAGVDSILESRQLKMSDYAKLLTQGMGFGDKKPANIGCSLTIGKILNIKSGLWLTGGKMSIPMVLDSSGQPLVWEVSYSFEYYKQITISDFEGMMGAKKE